MDFGRDEIIFIDTFLSAKLISIEAVKTFTVPLMNLMKKLRQEKDATVKFTVLQNVQKQKTSGEGQFFFSIYEFFSRLWRVCSSFLRNVF